MKRTNKQRELSNQQEGETHKQVTVKPGRVRAREHRERKKRYIQELEHEVKVLRERVDTLEQQLAEYKQITCETSPKSMEESKAHQDGIDGLLEQLRSEEKFAHEDLPKLIKTNPDNIKLTMIAQTNEKVGEFGTVRINLLKECFKTIIENIIPVDTKMVVAILSKNSINKCRRSAESNIKNTKVSFHYF